MPANTSIRLRKGTSTQWTTGNPVLASGEPGYDITNNILKIGDGSTTWSQLSNHNHTSSNITDFNSSVSGLLPTISDSGNNRILVSNGTSIGIKAYSNLIFNGQTLALTPTGVLPANISSNTITLNSWIDQLNNTAYPELNFKYNNQNTVTLTYPPTPGYQGGTFYFPTTNGGILTVGNNATTNYLTKWENENNKLTNSIIFESGNKIGIGTTTPASLLHVSGTTLANQFVSTNANNTTIGSGQIVLNGNIGNRIDFNISGVAPPSFTTNRSVGTKIVLSPNTSSTQTEYALGIESGAMWFSIPVTTSRAFKWYAGTANIATLLGNGTLTITGSTSQINVDDLRLDNNVISITATNSDLILKPNGNGSLLADNVGNPRGIYSNDFQRDRASVSGVAAGGYSVIAGGSDNRTVGSYSVIAGGQANIASNTWTTIAGGDSNSSSGSKATVGGGGNNIASGLAATVAGGANNEATGSYAIVPGGYRAKATRQGELSHAAGFFNAVGDAQHTVLIVRKLTTGNTENILTLNGLEPVESNSLILPAKTTWVFTAQISAYNNNDNSSAGWNIRGCIKRNGANTTNIIGSPIIESWADSAMNNCTATVTADDTNEALEIKVTGLSGKSIRWVAVVDLSQVSYGVP